MFTIKPLKIKSLTAEDPISLFLSNESCARGLNRSICFYRVIGMDGTDTSYIEKIKALDRDADNLSLNYIRLNKLDTPTPDTIQPYEGLYGVWAQVHHSTPEEIMKLPLPLNLSDEALEWSAKYAFYLIIKMYRNTTPNITETVLKTFLIKMLFWIERYLKPLFIGNTFPKIAVTGHVKKHESVFLLYCANMGCDILYMHPNTDLPAQYPDLLNRSQFYGLGTKRDCALPIPDYHPTQTAPPKEFPAHKPQATTVTRIPSNPEQSPSESSSDSQPNIIEPITAKPLTYEELADYSSSVVMISVFDKDKTCYQAGSGVVISDNGYILTNLHVVGGGEYFAIRFENDDKEYLTDTLVKYHTIYDLAVIRVDRRCRPISLHQEGPLARGQRIVAIGSPLGLFNTISDGIISGFRQINGANMIQFTAPISSGSSGGALINMNGRLVGIITAGFDKGQNLNLAMDHQTICDFAKPLIR